MSSSPLVIAWHGSVLEVRLDRPDRRNALNDDLVDGLLEAFTTEAHAARSVVLTGGDSFFCAGGDVGTMGTPADGLYGPARRLTRIHRVLTALRDLEAPSVCAVEGYAIGAGWGLALGADILVAADDAFFAAPFAERGLAADAGVAWHLNRRLGRHAAARHLLLGERLSATDARATGLVTQLSSPGAARTDALEIATTLAASATEAIAVTRWMAERSESEGSNDFLRSERIGVNLAGHGREAAEGRAAFTEKRKPEFDR